MIPADSDNTNVHSVATVLRPSPAPEIDATISAASEFITHPPPIISYLDQFNKFIIGLIIVVAVMTFVFGPLATAKIVVATIFACLALLCIAVLVLRGWLLHQLKEVEEMGYFFTDLTRVDAQEARIALRMLNERLDSQSHPVEAAMIPELLKNVGPLVKLLMSREKSTISWMMLGAKVAKGAFDIFNKRKPS